MKSSLALLLLTGVLYISTIVDAGLSLTDQLIMESRIQNQLQQQQRMNEFEQSLKLQAIEDEMTKLKRQQESNSISVDDAVILLWILQNRPDLLRIK